MPDSDDEIVLKFPILIGDIGGTNARFAILSDAYAEPKQFPIVRTADFVTIDDAIQSAILDKTTLQPLTMVLAVAGPVDGDEIALTNCPWVVKPKVMHEKLRIPDIIVLNDFEAQALAVVALGEEHMEKIGGGAPERNAGRVVLGPGTGLGVAGLVHAKGAWIPVPGEGGHMDIGPRTLRDHEIWPHIEPLEGRVSGEQILCGRGLVNAYRAVALANGADPKYPSPFAVPPDPIIAQAPAEITAAALEKTDPIAEEALELFVTCLGRTAGDLALVFKAVGGVFLTGGIAQKIVPALKTGNFRAAFEDKAPHSAMMREMPVYVITHPLAANAGLAAFARTPSRFGVEVSGRRWTSA
ncbi:MAG TPA: glucokinase [Rhizobiaceae bacterium]|nr:glucokinase [Rhizobiaceae bacterium]